MSLLSLLEDSGFVDLILIHSEKEGRADLLCHSSNANLALFVLFHYSMRFLTANAAVFHVNLNHALVLPRQLRNK